MSRNHKRLTLLVALILIPIFALLIREPTTTTFDLRDGTRLEVLRINHGKEHIAHLGSVPQKLLFKITGPRLSYRWVGPSFVIPAQDSVNGNLGLFVRHRIPPHLRDTHSSLHLNIQPVSRPHKDHAVFISSGAGEYGLLELNYWKENHSDFIITNSRNEEIARFQIIKDDRGRYTISDVTSATTQTSGRR